MQHPEGCRAARASEKLPTFPNLPLLGAAFYYQGFPGARGSGVPAAAISARRFCAGCSGFSVQTPKPFFWPRWCLTAPLGSGLPQGGGQETARRTLLSANLHA